MNEGDLEILDNFARTRERTIELYQALPDNLLHRRADGEQWPTWRLFMHMAAGVHSWMSLCMKDGQPAKSPADDEPAAVLAELISSRDRLLTFFRRDDGEAMGRSFVHAEHHAQPTSFTGRNRVHYLTTHEVHHRGKIVLALRQWGFERIPFLPF